MLFELPTEEEQLAGKANALDDDQTPMALNNEYHEWLGKRIAGLVHEARTQGLERTLQTIAYKWPHSLPQHLDTEEARTDERARAAKTQPETAC